MAVWDGELYRAVFPFEGLGSWDADVYTALARAVGGPVLELGCGTGRILLALRGSGVDADGLELDASMRSVAEHRLRASGDSETRVIAGDMTTFESRRRYRLVLVPDNTLATLHDDSEVLAMLRRVRRCLSEGGELALDHTLLDRAPPVHRWPDRDVVVDGVQMRVELRGCYEADARTYRVTVAASCEGRAPRSMELALRQRTPAEIVALLHQGGFAPVAPPVDERGRPVDPDSHMFVGRFAASAAE